MSTISQTGLARDTSSSLGRGRGQVWLPVAHALNCKKCPLSGSFLVLLFSCVCASTVKRQIPQPACGLFVLFGKLNSLNNPCRQSVMDFTAIDPLMYLERQEADSERWQSSALTAASLAWPTSSSPVTHSSVTPWARLAPRMRTCWPAGQH